LKFHQVYQPSRVLGQLSQSILALEQLPPFSQPETQRMKSKDD
jgi:hypothetical protein